MPHSLEVVDVDLDLLDQYVQRGRRRPVVFMCADYRLNERAHNLDARYTPYFCRLPGLCRWLSQPHYVNTLSAMCAALKLGWVHLEAHMGCADFAWAFGAHHGRLPSFEEEREHHQRSLDEAAANIAQWPNIANDAHISTRLHVIGGGPLYERIWRKVIM